MKSWDSSCVWEPVRLPRSQWSGVRSGCRTGPETSPARVMNPKGEERTGVYRSVSVGGLGRSGSGQEEVRSETKNRDVYREK